MKSIVEFLVNNHVHSFEWWHNWITNKNALNNYASLKPGFYRIHDEDHFRGHTETYERIIKITSWEKEDTGEIFTRKYPCIGHTEYVISLDLGKSNNVSNDPDAVQDKGDYRVTAGDIHYRVDAHTKFLKPTNEDNSMVDTVEQFIKNHPYKFLDSYEYGILGWICVDENNEYSFLADKNHDIYIS